MAGCGVSAGNLVRRDREVRADLDVVDVRATPSHATAGGSCWSLSLAHIADAGSG